MENAKRTTYALQELRELLQSHQLKGWCEERKLCYPTMYKVASGSTAPSYKVISSLISYIAPAKWIYFTDEMIPFEMPLLEAWNPDDIPYFVRKHKYDYIDVLERFGITESYSRNLFLNHRARPSLLLMRKAADEGTDPAEFFTKGDENDDGKFYPERGDIVTVSEKNVLVLSSRSYNRVNGYMTAVPYDGGKINPAGLWSIKISRTGPKLIGRAEPDELEDITKQLVALVKGEL